MAVFDYETLIYFNPVLVCNFSCVYCGLHNSRWDLLKDIDIERIVQRFDKINRTLLVCVCGGEPFSIPNFTEFIAEITKKHYVRIDTNLSLGDACRKFANTINPRRVVEVVFSTHVLERERRGIDLKEQVSLAKEFQKKGFKILGNYVVYPPLFERLERDMEFYNSQGVAVVPTFFGGKFNGKTYPFDRGVLSYSDEEVNMITRLNPYAKIYMHNPLNEYCQAGCNAFFISDKYEVFPCFTMQDIKLGDFDGKWRTYPKVIRCPRRYCTDQFNKAFYATLDTFSLGYLQLLAISRKGVCSSLKSQILLGRGSRYLLNKLLQYVMWYWWRITHLKKEKTK